MDESTPASDSSSPIQTSAWPWHLLAACLIVGSAFLHIAYLVHDCPLDLAPDEAHYWDWSRHLDWSYYSKGPLIAYLIRLSVTITGSWSEQLTGSLMLAVRLPAVVCGGLLLLGLYVLTLQTYGRPRLATGVVAIAMIMPAIAAGSTLMTIDAPFVCCWCWALVFGYQAMCRGSSWAWPLAGLTVGLGILAKYTMVLWLISAVLFLLTDSRRRKILFQPGFWITTMIAAACCLPILIWNIEHDWLGLRHVTGLAGLGPLSSGIKWLGPLSYLGQQAALHLGFWFVFWFAAMIVYRPWSVGRARRLPSRFEPDSAGASPSRNLQELDKPKEYLWWFSAPTFLIFLLFSFKTGGGEPNWPVAAYISGLVLSAGWLTTRLFSSSRLTRRLTHGGLSIACGFALALSLVLHHTALAYPAISRFSDPPTASRPLPMRRFDPTCRLRGWRQLAAEVDRLRSRLQAEGIDPVIAAGSWSLPGELAFYCQGHPTVYSVGLALADRHSQYDLWRPNPVFDPDQFRGRTMIFVGEINPTLRQSFAEIDPPEIFTFCDGYYPLASWTIVVCRDFRGFDQSGASYYQSPF
ncbi:MAG TPA: glycosyltransferase family 39 protein [Gemmataceae bacterium]|jgi:4-amino-4-deoxy-L-arabinose transferase-like glycosyltransferase|nr:glycosyltransferase family 39 protein [Gemmataceae bacterium]